jgi:septum site-determining protein MinD
MKIAIAGGKGGCSKTTTSINLAIALNNLDKDVLLVDCNLTTPNVGLYLGVPYVEKTIHDVLSGSIKLEESIYLHKSGLKIVPGSISIEKLIDLKPELLKKKLKNLDNDYVILDCSAGLGRESLSVLEACDKILIVTNPEIPAATDALKTIKLADELNKEVIGIVLSRRTGKDEMTVNAVEKLLERPVIAVINEDKNMKESLVKSDPIINLYPYSEASIGYKKLACYLTGKKYKNNMIQEAVQNNLKETFTDFLNFVFGKK